MATNDTNQPTSLIWVQGNKLQLALPLQIVTFTDEGKTTEDYNPPSGSTILVCLAGKFRCFRYTPTISDGNVLHIVDNGELPADSYSVTIIVEEPNGTKRRCKWNYIINVYDSNEKVTDYFDDFPDWGSGAILEGSVFYATGGGGGGGVQSDWNETDTSSLAYIKNKPSLPVSGATNGNFAGLDASGNVKDSGKKASDFATSSHTHGNITNAGALQTTDISIANGDKLVVTDASNSNKVARASVAFDGSTTTTALTPKGTFEAFYKKPSSGIPASDLASGVIPDVSGKEDTSNKTSDISSNASSTTKYPTTKGVADYAEAKMAIVAASGTTLTASVNNYYLFSSDVGTLAITLTTPSDTTHITKAVFMLTTGASPAVTFAGASGVNVIAQDGFAIEASTTYEINAIYNGVAWVVATMKLSSTPINS